jgi:manganese/iron transport system substrate-binding protein
MPDKFYLCFGAGILAIATSACNPESNQPISSPAKILPQVVATTTVICGLTKQIAVDTIDLKCLLDPDTDPHVYEPKPSDRMAIESAQLILYGGYGFEPALIKLITATSNASPKVAINEIAVPMPQKFEDQGKLVNDPHVWHSAKNGIKIAKAITKNLTTLRPDQADTYAKNALKITTELEQIDAWIKLQVATIPVNSRKLVTTHDALGYYAKAYDIPIEGALSGISTEEQATAARIKELVKVIKGAKVPTIFAEVTLNPKLITTVAKEAGVKVSERELFTDGLGGEAETYAGMLIANTRSIVEGLGGAYTPFKAK